MISYVSLFEVVCLFLKQESKYNPNTDPRTINAISQVSNPELAEDDKIPLDDENESIPVELVPIKLETIGVDEDCRIEDEEFKKGRNAVDELVEFVIFEIDSELEELKGKLNELKRLDIPETIEPTNEE